MGQKEYGKEKIKFVIGNDCGNVSKICKRFQYSESERLIGTVFHRGDAGVFLYKITERGRFLESQAESYFGY